MTRKVRVSSPEKVWVRVREWESALFRWHLSSWCWGTIGWVAGRLEVTSTSESGLIICVHRFNFNPNWLSWTAVASLLVLAGQRTVLVLGSRERWRKKTFACYFLPQAPLPPLCPTLHFIIFQSELLTRVLRHKCRSHRGSKLDGSCDKKAEEQMPRSTWDRSTRNPRRCKGKNQTFRGACNLRNLGQILTSVSRICPESGQQFGNDGKGCHFGQI